MYKKYKGIDSREIICCDKSKNTIEAGISFEKEDDIDILRFHFLEDINLKSGSTIITETTKSMFLDIKSIKELVKQLQLIIEQKLITYYEQGFINELYNKDKKTFKDELQQRAYSLGRLDAEAGDDVRSIDLSSEKDILKRIYNKQNSFSNEDLRELENEMERWHVGRSEDSDVADLLNEKLIKIGKLTFFNKKAD